MLRKSPGHGFDATEGGTLMSKSSDDDIKIIEFMVVNDQKSEHSRGHHTKKSDILEL